LELKSKILENFQEGNHEWVSNSVEKIPKISGAMKPHHHRNISMEEGTNCISTQCPTPTNNQLKK